MASRFLQGLGSAILITAGLALVSRHNPPEHRGRAVGQYLGLVAAVPAMGPFLSGALLEVFSWRWLSVGLLGIYITVFRPRQLRWGATDEEVARSMPGDEIVARPSSTLPGQ